jgi:hypothetical protein
MVPLVIIANSNDLLVIGIVDARAILRWRNGRVGAIATGERAGGQGSRQDQDDVSRTFHAVKSRICRHAGNYEAPGFL